MTLSGFAETADGPGRIHLTLRKIQFHADAVRIEEKELRVAGTRHDAFTKVDVFGLEALAHALHIGRGKGDAIEAAGVFAFLFSLKR